MRVAPRAYVDSGLYGFWEQVEADLARDPGSWEHAEVERLAWGSTVEWELYELWRHVLTEMALIFGDPPPAFPWPELIYPPSSASECGHARCRPGWNTDGRGGALVSRDDMIVVTSDDDQDDGIDVSPVFEWCVDTSGSFPIAKKVWKPLVIPGVHRDIAPALSAGYWMSVDHEPTFTVPTGAVSSTYKTFEVPNPNGPPFLIPIPLVVLWYGTAINPTDNNFPNPQAVAFDDANPRRNPRSWVGLSFDGETFYAGYENASGEAIPFSADEAPDCQSGQCGDAGFPARFINVAAVDIPGWLHDELPIDVGPVDVGAAVVQISAGDGCTCAVLSVES